MPTTRGTARRGPLRAAGVGAAVAGGLALGFVAERALVRAKLVPPLPPAERPLGEISGEQRRIDGPDGTRVLVETYGPAGAPQVVLAHGWILTGRAWHEQVVRLQDRYRLVTYDQPGHGRSSPPASGAYDLDLLGDTLAAVVEAATEPGPLVVAGHSLGGMGILNAVRRHPAVRERLAGVVLLSTTSSARSERLTLEVGIRAAARLERGIRRLVPTLRDPRVVQVADRVTTATSDLSYLVARWTAVGPDADPHIVAFTQQLALESGSDVVLGLVESVLGVDEDAGLDALAGSGVLGGLDADARLDADGGLDDLAGSDVLGGLDALAAVPTTIVVGTHDRLTPTSLSRRMAERTRGRLVVLPRVGHMAPLEAGAEVSELLVSHLSSDGRTYGGRR